MPHIVLEHTSNVSPDNSVPDVLRQIHQIASCTGGITLANCKSRCYVLDQFCIGDGDSANAFVHLDVRFVEGRSLKVRQLIGEQLKHCLVQNFVGAAKSSQLQITVEVRDIHLDEYFKYPEGTLTRQL